MKKIFLGLCLAFLAACGTGGELEEILVVSREAGSGARGAFEEMAEIQDEVAYGLIAQGSNGVLTTVEQNIGAIGYVTYGLLSGRGVRAVSIDGVPFSGAAALDGIYPFAIGFHMAFNYSEVSDEARTFLEWVMNSDGQAIVSAEEYVPTQTGAFANTGSPLNGGNSNGGTIIVAGSTTVAPIAQELADAFMEAHPSYIVEVQSMGTGAGMTAAIEGTADVGLASRNLNEAELETLGFVTFAIDGLAIIVNEDNELSNLTFEQVQTIFRGEVTEWSEFQ
ncbi:MAG: substrate-binding domain-containing protein [Defluviitaleaceae bacterium]|nr:substrate-binding domain-containing protein [Defluviitaleaceae bacterium]